MGLAHSGNCRVQLCLELPGSLDNTVLRQQPGQDTQVRAGTIGVCRQEWRVSGLTLQ